MWLETAVATVFDYTCFKTLLMRCDVKLLLGKWCALGDFYCNPPWMEIKRFWAVNTPRIAAVLRD